MNLDLLLKLVREPASIEAANQADLEALVAEYPYFTAAQLLLLKSYKEQNSIHFSKQLRKMAAMAPSREHVYDLMEVLPSLEETMETEVFALEQTPQQIIEEQIDVPAAILEAELSTESPDNLFDTETAAEASEVVEATDEILKEPSLQPEALGISLEMIDTTEEVLLEEEAVLTEMGVSAETSPEHVFADDTPALLQEEVDAEAHLYTSGDAVAEEVVGEVPSEVALQSEAPVDTFEEEQSITETAEKLEESVVENSATAPKDSEAPALTIAAAPETATDFIQLAHDRLSWFRYFAGKPLREQPEDVLEQLYMEHMQQDLLKAPESTPETSIKAKVNFAEEVESSVSMEEEIKRLAYDSISDDELPASETLARIYEQQHEYKRAIKIYQKLILKFPDKMTYFAGLIEELRKKA